MGKIEGIKIQNYGALKDIVLGKTRTNQNAKALGNLVAVIGPSGNGKSTLADIVYPQGYLKLKKRAVGKYSEIGNAKCEWADKIGKCLHLHENSSPSYQYFIGELEKRIIA
ncbi:hypothetical protein C808_04729 [Lachnospiraceae bacterium M18-1]|nr:hypothetical protein C808_04729 [Lachnospiraceae bacterium M18-1]